MMQDLSPAHPNSGFLQGIFFPNARRIQVLRIERNFALIYELNFLVEKLSLE